MKAGRAGLVQGFARGPGISMGRDRLMLVRFQLAERDGSVIKVEDVVLVGDEGKA